MAESKRRNYYAVLRGNATGIFSAWNECQEATKDYPDCKYKGFFARKAAENRIKMQMS